MNQDPRWQGLYRLGGTAALVNAVVLLGEMIVYAVLPRAGSAADHFALFRDNWLAGLLTLDLLGLISYLLFVPTILAFYVMLRRMSEAVMAVAAAFFFIGVAAFFATNTAFPVLALSTRYAASTTDAERAMILAAGQAMFTLFNENAFLVSYVVVSLAWTMIATIMLRSTMFGRLTGVAGLLAGVTGLVAVGLEHVTIIDALSVAIGLYFTAIVCLLMWVVLAGRRLSQLGRAPRAG